MKAKHFYEAQQLDLNEISDLFELADKIKVVVDAVNGPVVSVLEKLFKDTQCELIIINEQFSRKLSTRFDFRTFKLTNM